MTMTKKGRLGKVTFAPMAPRSGAPHHVRLLEVGEVVRTPDGVFHEVTSATVNAVLKALTGRSIGATTVCTRHAAGYEHVDRGEAESAVAAARERASREADEAEGRHEYVAGEVGECAVCGGPKDLVTHRKRPSFAKADDDPEVVEKIAAMRAAGMAYHKIEKELGWPDTRGGRPWSIMKRAGKLEGRKHGEA